MERESLKKWREKSFFFNILSVLTYILATWLSVEGVAIGNKESGETSSDHVTIRRPHNEVKILLVYPAFSCVSPMYM